MVRDNLRVSDGSISLEGGVNSGNAPSLLKPNEVSFAVNTTFRGGYPKPRPGFRKIALSFGGDAALETAFKTGRFQVVGTYNTDLGNLQLISMHGGKVFRTDVSPSGSFVVQDISIAGDLNAANREYAWTVQAENYFLLQDGQSKCFIYNGADSRRAIATQNEIFVGQQMTYMMGRIWIANGRDYVAGDIVFGDSGTAANGLRDSILRFTENQFLAEGGSFTIPLRAGDITGLQPIENINTALGQGSLIVGSNTSVFATDVPPDRLTWKDTREPLQRVVQIKYGPKNDRSMVNINGDLYYRSDDGIRSLSIAVRNFGQPGNIPISNEVGRILEKDDLRYLKFCSAVNFDNRLLMTCSPARTEHGVYHRGIVVLDFDLVSSMSERMPPAYDGMWTGIRVLQLVTGLDNGTERCFAYVLNTSNEIELWEITRSDRFDHDGTDEIRIAWFYETRLMPFDGKFSLKQLETADIFIANLDSTVDFDVKYRPDGYSCWVDWDTFTECAKTTYCSDDFTTCPSLPNYQLQHRSNLHLKQPADTFDSVSKKLLRNGYEFQFRHAFVGYCEVRQCRYNAHIMEDDQHEL